MLKEIIRKELKRVFTDKRLIISTFVIPAISIYVIYTLIGHMAGSVESDIQKHQSTILVSDAPNSFEDFYNSNKDNYNMNVAFGQYNRNDEADAIKTGKLDLLIQFDNQFDLKVENYQDFDTAPEIMTFYNPTEDYSTEARGNFLDLLNDYQSVLLTNRFGNINYVQPFVIDTTNNESMIMDEKKASSSGLAIIVPMLLAIMLFAGAMGIGMDTIAGEKERGTMATLLLTPVPRETIALGKVISLGIVAIISSTCSFIAIIASLPNMMGSISNGTSEMKLAFNGGQYLELFIIMIVLVAIYVGIICLISVRARSVKEAGTYVAPAYMVIMVASMSTMFARGDVDLYKFAIPIYGSIMAIKKMFAFELTFQQFAVSTGVSIVAAALLISFITKTFNDEKVMFNA